MESKLDQYLSSHFYKDPTSSVNISFSEAINKLLTFCFHRVDAAVPIQYFDIKIIHQAEAILTFNDTA